MKKRRIIQPILWTERPTGAVMGAGSLWPLVTRPRTGSGQHRFAWWYLQLCTSRWLILHELLINKLLSTPMDVMCSLMSVSHCRQPKVLWKKAAWYWKGLMINNPPQNRALVVHSATTICITWDFQTHYVRFANHGWQFFNSCSLLTAAHSTTFIRLLPKLPCNGQQSMPAKIWSKNIEWEGHST